MEKIFELKNVSKKYKNGKRFTEAVKGISFSLKEGESTAIVGPSGSGKSTLLNLIGGLEKPTTGEVFVAGKNIVELSDAELSKFRNRTIGFIFQFFNLQDYLFAYENVMLPMLLGGVDSKLAKEKAMALLDKVGLLKRADYYPNQLSGGEMQRIAIARSLANDPRILLADEPTANLDRSSADNVLDIIDGIRENGMSVVMITHDISVSKRFDNVINIHDGILAK